MIFSFQKRSEHLTEQQTQQTQPNQTKIENKNYNDRFNISKQLILEQLINITRFLMVLKLSKSAKFSLRVFNPAVIFYGKCKSH